MIKKKKLCNNLKKDNNDRKDCHMIAFRELLSFSLVLAFTASGIVFANSKNEEDKLNLLNSVSWTEAIKDPSSTSGMISYYSSIRPLFHSSSLD